MSKSEQLTLLHTGGNILADPEESLQSIACHCNLQSLSMEGTFLGKNGCKLLELLMASERKLKLRNISMRSCGVKGENLIQTGNKIKEESNQLKLHLLDLSLNHINRLQQTIIKKLYQNFVNMLVIDIALHPQSEYVAMM